METECLWLLFGVCRTQIFPYDLSVLLFAVSGALRTGSSCFVLAA